MMAVLKEKQSASFLGEMLVLLPASYNISKYLMVEDTCFPCSYTPVDMQASLVDWGKFAIRYNLYLKQDSLDEQTVEVVLVRQSIHVAPHARLTLAFMDTRFPQVIELLTRSYKPSEHFQGKTLKLCTHPYDRISDGYSRNPYMLSTEYATSMIKYLVENGIVMIEGQELPSNHNFAENRSYFYSVTTKGRKMLCEGIGRIAEFNCSKKREHYTLFISKFFTGRGWNDKCINPSCLSKVIRNNEYASIHDFGLDRKEAFNNGFSICGKCARDKFFDKKAHK